MDHIVVSVIVLSRLIEVIWTGGKCHILAVANSRTHTCTNKNNFKIIFLQMFTLEHIMLCVVDISHVLKCVVDIWNINYVY